MATCINNKGEGDIWECKDYRDVIQCCFPPCLCNEDDHGEISTLRKDYEVKCPDEPDEPDEPVECGELYFDGLECDNSGVGNLMQGSSIAAFACMLASAYVF